MTPATSGLERAGGHTHDRDGQTRRPALLDVATRLEQAWKLYQEEPESAIEGVERLTQSHAPNPFVLHALGMMLARSGDMDRAQELAHEAMPLCLELGQMRLAAELYKMLRRRARSLELNLDELLALALELRQMQQWRTAANAYVGAIKHERLNRKAIKGLLQLAHIMLHQENAPADAGRVYAFLLSRCAESPLVDYMHDGMAEVERRLAPERLATPTAG